MIKSETYPRTPALSLSGLHYLADKSEGELERLMRDHNKPANREGTHGLHPDTR